MSCNNNRRRDKQNRFFKKVNFLFFLVALLSKQLNISQKKHYHFCFRSTNISRIQKKNSSLFTLPISRNTLFFLLSQDPFLLIYSVVFMARFTFAHKIFTFFVVSIDNCTLHDCTIYCFCFMNTFRETRLSKSKMKTKIVL